MIGKNTIKLINAISQKKGRLKENLFLVEGDKNVAEVLDSNYKVEKLFATASFLQSNELICKNAKQVFEVEHPEIKKASLLQHPQNSLAICQLPNNKNKTFSLRNKLSIYLDDIQDPGNLGTIIRICDWFDVELLFVSPNTVDFYNPKVIQASMGSFTRVGLIEIEFEKLVAITNKNHIPVFGTFLDGENIYRQKLPSEALVVMGNEGNGITPKTATQISNRLTIPSVKKLRVAESLNVSVATSIVCSEFKRASFC